jgi:hypothetical protein
MDYRLYFMNDKGHITDAVELLCDDDEKALDTAEQYRDGRDLELWQLGRCVKKIPRLS